MGNFPSFVDGSGITISSFSTQSLGGQRGLFGSLAVSGAWPTANTAIYIPFRIAYPVAVVKIMWLNGGTVSGNVDAGIYDSEGHRLVSSGSTAQATINVIQSVDTADVILYPGLYYMAMAVDNTTATLRRASAISNAVPRAAGVYSQASAFALPATATYSGSISSFVPVMALTTRILV